MLSFLKYHFITLKHLLIDAKKSMNGHFFYCIFQRENAPETGILGHKKTNKQTKDKTKTPW